MSDNLDHRTVDSFGDEWSRFDQASLPREELRQVFEKYFSIFPWEDLPPGASGFDMGSGSGRWADFVAPRVHELTCVEPSEVFHLARRALAHHDNIRWDNGSIDCNSIAPGSQDFGYSLGVLHHTPDPARALASCVQLLKPGAPFLLYIYYAFDNRSPAFRLAWKLSDAARKVVHRLPSTAKQWVTDALALLVYWPLARLSLLLEKAGVDVSPIPLSFYRHSSLFTMRTDSRDRFGTPLEWRFTREEIAGMMHAAGLDRISFREDEPYWCAVGYRTR